MRHLPRRLTPLALASLLALSACASPTPDAEFDEPGTSASDTTATQSADDAAGADDQAGEQADEPEKTADAPVTKDPSASTVRYTNEYKTILTMDRGQVEALTGTDLHAGVDKAQKAMTQGDTWSGDDTAEYADLITEAADREADRIDRVLRTMAQGGDVELRLYIGHHEHAKEAHFGEDGDDD